MDKVVLKIILRYKGKDYECEAYAWVKDYIYPNGEQAYRSGYEFDSVRNCEHDYGALLPEEVRKDVDFGCDEKEIEVQTYWFYDKVNNKNLTEPF